MIADAVTMTQSHYSMRMMRSFVVALSCFAALAAAELRPDGNGGILRPSSNAASTRGILNPSRNSNGGSRGVFYPGANNNVGGSNVYPGDDRPDYDGEVGEFIKTTKERLNRKNGCMH